MPDQKRIMAVSGHPADFCSRSGGTLIKHANAGAVVKVLWMTQGETEESIYLYEQQPDITLDEVRKIREAEGFAAAEVVGAEGKMFAFGDGPLHMTDERIDMLAREIAEFDPHIIYTHWLNERTHPSHHVTSLATLKAARLAQASKMDVRFFEPHLGSAGRSGRTTMSTSPTLSSRRSRPCASWRPSPRMAPSYTICAQWRGLECGGAALGVEYAEGFVRYMPEVVLGEMS